MSKKAACFKAEKPARASFLPRTAKDEFACYFNGDNRHHPHLAMPCP
jgi:hypothetical protein